MNRGDLIYLIGVPGAGKTTLAKELFQNVKGVVMTKPFLHVVHPGGVELGGPRDKFAGTDALPMNVQPLVLPFLLNNIWDLAFAEGDRLANGKFFDACTAAGWTVHVVLLDAPEGLAAARRTARGSTQAETWVKGRVTKVGRLWASYGAIRLDASEPTSVLASRLAKYPPMARLLGGRS
jgi:chloramphenicol 3-O-phosphotransferase